MASGGAQNGTGTKCAVWSECPECLLTEENIFYKSVSSDKARCDYPQYRHAAHAMIYARDDRVFLGTYKMIADILMQVRFDGLLGFGGGVVDDTDESVIDGLNRELVEEMNLNMEKHRITESDHVITNVCSHKQLVTYFYAIEVSVPDLEEIERRTFTAHDWGTETLGTLRVPLHTMPDGVRGFPLFLAGQQFIGNSKHQLLHTLVERNIMPADDVKLAVIRSQKIFVNN